MSDLGSGWYLDRIEVMGPEGAVWCFPCHNWLGKSDAGDHRGACPSASPGIRIPYINVPHYIVLKADGTVRGSASCLYLRVHTAVPCAAST